MKRIVSILICLVVMLSISAFSESSEALQEMYAEAELLMAQGDYSGAASKFEALGTYSDSSQMAMYAKAIYSAESFGMYDIAVNAFNGLGDFRDSKQMAVYYEARGLEASGDAIDIETASVAELSSPKMDYQKAIEKYSALALFKDSLERLTNCNLKITTIQARIDAEEEANNEAVYQSALRNEIDMNYQDAISEFSSIISYKDSSDHLEACKAAYYEKAVELESEKNYAEAKEIYEYLGEYKDCKERIKACEEGLYTIFDAIQVMLVTDTCQKEIAYITEHGVEYPVITTEELETICSNGRYLYEMSLPYLYRTFYMYSDGIRTQVGRLVSSGSSFNYEASAKSFDEITDVFRRKVIFKDNTISAYGMKSDTSEPASEVYQMRKIAEGFYLKYEADSSGEFTELSSVVCEMIYQNNSFTIAPHTEES